MREATISTGKGKFQQTIEIGPHRLLADEVAELGGDDTGPAPHDLLLAALGACTSMTLKMYADRKSWPLERVEVKLSQEKQGDAHVFSRKIRLEGALDDEQRGKLLEIANKYPVHKTLSGTIRIESQLA